MKTQMMLPAIMLLAGCDSGENDTEVANATIAQPEATAPAVVEASNAKLPFDMPIMPGARYLSGSDFISLKRGQEAIATIIAKGTPSEVVKYYEKALTENGFTPTLAKYNDDSTANVWGVRGDGEKFSVTSIRGGSKAEPGESQTGIVATKPNLP